MPVSQTIVETYNAALQDAYDKYLRKEISYDEADIMEAQTLFVGLDIPELSPE